MAVQSAGPTLIFLESSLVCRALFNSIIVPLLFQSFCHFPPTLEKGVFLLFCRSTKDGPTKNTVRNCVCCSSSGINHWKYSINFCFVLFSDQELVMGDSSSILDVLSSTHPGSRLDNAVIIESRM